MMCGKVIFFFGDQKQASLAFYLSVDPRLNLPQINIHKNPLNLTVMSPAGFNVVSFKSRFPSWLRGCLEAQTLLKVQFLIVCVCVF